MTVVSTIGVLKELKEKMRDFHSNLAAVTRFEEPQKRLSAHKRTPMPPQSKEWQWDIPELLWLLESQSRRTVPFGKVYWICQVPVLIGDIGLCTFFFGLEDIIIIVCFGLSWFRVVFSTIHPLGYQSIHFFCVSCTFLSRYPKDYL